MNRHIQEINENLKDSGSIKFFIDYYSQLKNAFIVNVGSVCSDNGMFPSMTVRLDGENITRELFVSDKQNPKMPGYVIFISSEDGDNISMNDFNGSVITNILLATDPEGESQIERSTVALSIRNGERSFIVGFIGNSKEEMNPGLILGLPIPLMN